jgi:hypothetical protein
MVVLRILGLQTVMAILVVSIVNQYWGAKEAVDAALGALTITLSMGLMVWALWRIFQQKMFALSISVIVFKYAILGLIMFALVAQQRVDVIWYAVGISSMIPTTLLSPWLLGKEDSFKN